MWQILIRLVIRHTILTIGMRESLEDINYLCCYKLFGLHFYCSIRVLTDGASLKVIRFTVICVLVAII